MDDDDDNNNNNNNNNYDNNNVVITMGISIAPSKAQGALQWQE